jgi:hypothetical protein
MGVEIFTNTSGVALGLAKRVSFYIRVRTIIALRSDYIAGSRGEQGAQASSLGYSGELTKPRVSREWLAPEQEQQAY